MNAILGKKIRPSERSITRYQDQTKYDLGQNAKWAHFEPAPIREPKAPSGPCLSPHAPLLKVRSAERMYLYLHEQKLTSTDAEDRTNRNHFLALYFGSTVFEQWQHKHVWQYYNTE